MVIITCNFLVKLFGFVNCLGKLLSLFGFFFDNLHKREMHFGDLLCVFSEYKKWVFVVVLCGF